MAATNNETIQARLEITGRSKLKSNSFRHRYQGDVVSKLLVSLTKKYIIEPVLDAGAGTGALVTELKNKGFSETRGIDLFPKADFIKKGVITNLDFSDASMETVFCTEVLEHLDNRQLEKAINEIFRVLKKKGILIVTVPFKENLEKNRLTCPHCSKRFHKVGHLQSFSKSRMLGMLKKHGFRILQARVCCLGAMAKIPLGKYLNFILKRLEYESIKKSILVVAQK